ncbi:VOC family protein [Methylobacterium sp. J-048]|uniref:VOC family protein n=1 Tax=Methylobacterium sp. J-048 TaxID=2836635 RepID=UPI001FBB6515|nr:VOC family protein [Methylobacterium sp. J-048]MCJ2057400.1 VOC family protein [Methylobacterium sp. J-048]
MAIIGRHKPGQFGLFLVVKDVAAAADFYRAVLGAEEILRTTQDEPIRNLDRGTVTAIEMRLGDIHLCVTLENPRWSEAPRPDWPRAPHSAGTTTAHFSLYVSDVDDAMSRALSAGARLYSAGPAIEDAYWGDRVGQFVDPFGHVWRLMTAREAVADEDLPARAAAARASHRGMQPGRHA